MNKLFIKWISYPNDLSDAFFIRTKVFVEEQNCPPEWEFDDTDKVANHVLFQDENKKPIATARVYKTDNNQGKIGRIAVLKEYRGKGFGALIVKECMRKLEHQNYSEILIHAQTYAIPFYEKLGFTAFGKEFIEDGITHIKMLYKKN